MTSTNFYFRICNLSWKDTPELLKCLSTFLQLCRRLKDDNSLTPNSIFWIYTILHTPLYKRRKFGRWKNLVILPYKISSLKTY